MNPCIQSTNRKYMAIQGQQKTWRFTHLSFSGKNIFEINLFSVSTDFDNIIIWHISQWTHVIWCDVGIKCKFLSIIKKLVLEFCFLSVHSFNYIPISMWSMCYFDDVDASYFENVMSLAKTNNNIHTAHAFTYWIVWDLSTHCQRCGSISLQAVVQSVSCKKSISWRDSHSISRWCLVFERLKNKCESISHQK